MESVNVLKDGKENIAKIELVLKIVMIMDYVIMLNAFASRQYSITIQNRFPWGGKYCQEKVCKFECLNGGTCLDGTCKCTAKWTGEDCSHLKVTTYHH
jgi:hypothetical protein